MRISSNRWLLAAAIAAVVAVAAIGGQALAGSKHGSRSATAWAS